jgi:succinyl-CoA synthetase beta subunit
MKIHEYQAKELLRSYGLPVSTGYVCSSINEVKKAIKHYDSCVIKAQVHAGGRGKAGGIRLAKNKIDALTFAKQILGMNLITKQTGSTGKLVNKVLITETVHFLKEYYLGITLNYEQVNLLIIASSAGGTEIEEISTNHPELITQIPISFINGYREEDGQKVADALNMPSILRQQLISILEGMIKLYLDKDCTLVEINPLVITNENQLLCLDAKITFDDNALFRHPDIKALRDIDEEDPKEYYASSNGLSYVTLDGDIGCLVNGAGLAMATMDIIKNYGGTPANFLDVGGGATIEQVTTAFKILSADSNLKSIFINIFGGIMKCDTIAHGLIEAAKDVGIKLPVIVRLEGNNVELGRSILDASGLDIITAIDMADGARKAIKAAREST